MATRIRPAALGDLATLARFGLALAHVHVALDDRRFRAPGRGLQAYLEFFEPELERPESALLIAELDATAVGYAFVRMEPSSLEALLESSAWLHDAYVEPPFRGRGIGRQLVGAAIESARRLGSASLMLEVSPENTTARQLYERFGMRRTMMEMRLDFD
jgi:ribosomal protein S18 acetylase RimI-like enzyme